MYEQEVLDFKRRMLEAEIRMNGMIAENQYRISSDLSPAYGEDAFWNLFDQLKIRDCDLPVYKGE